MGLKENDTGKEKLDPGPGPTALLFIVVALALLFLGAL